VKSDAVVAREYVDLVPTFVALMFVFPLATTSPSVILDGDRNGRPKRIVHSMYAVVNTDSVVPQVIFVATTLSQSHPAQGQVVTQEPSVSDVSCLHNCLLTWKDTMRAGQLHETATKVSPRLLLPSRGTSVCD